MTPAAKPDLRVRIGSLELRNPVLVASGIIGYGKEYERLVDLEAIGGIVTKTVTLRPRAGNPPPRVVETAAGMLNSIGIENPGLDGYLEQKVPILRDLPCARIVSDPNVCPRAAIARNTRHAMDHGSATAIAGNAMHSAN